MGVQVPLPAPLKYITGFPVFFMPAGYDYLNINKISKKIKTQKLHFWNKLITKNNKLYIFLKK